MPSFSKLVVGVVVVSGVTAVMLLIAYFALRYYLQRQKRAARAARAAKKKEKQGPEEAVPKTHAGSEKQIRSDETKPRRKRYAVGLESSSDPLFSVSGPIKRDTETIRLEQELKRDSLNVFHRLHAEQDAAERSKICREAVELFDSIPDRLGCAMASITSGRIVFCNALMSVGGLDDLRICQEAKDDYGKSLIERVVPVIYAT